MSFSSDKYALDRSLIIHLAESARLGLTEDELVRIGSLNAQKKVGDPDLVTSYMGQGNIRLTGKQWLDRCCALFSLRYRIVDSGIAIDSLPDAASPPQAPPKE